MKRTTFGQMMRLLVIVTIWAGIGFNVAFRLLPPRHMTVRYVNCPTLTRAP